MAASVDRYRRGLAGVEKEGHVLPNATRAVLEAVEVLHSMLEGSHARLLIGNEAALGDVGGVGGSKTQRGGAARMARAGHMGCSPKSQVDHREPRAADGSLAGRQVSPQSPRAAVPQDGAPRAIKLVSCGCDKQMQSEASPRAVHLWTWLRQGGRPWCLDEGTCLQCLMAFNPQWTRSRSVLMAAISCTVTHLGILRCRPKSFLGGARATGVWVHPDDARALWFPAVREASRGAVVLQLDKRARLSASQSNFTMLQGIVKLC